MFCASLAEYNLQIPDELEPIVNALAPIGPEDFLDAVARHTYKQPIAQIMPNMEAGLAQNFMHEWLRLYQHQSEAPRAKGSQMNISSILD